MSTNGVTTPGRATELARQAEHHRTQGDIAEGRGDAGEAALWRSMAAEIDAYLTPALTLTGAALFELAQDPGG